MILNLTESETAVLLLHMTIMRKGVRNTFKRNHSKESKEMLSSFDEIKNNLEEAIQEETDNIFHYNIKEINMLHSFIGSYTIKLVNTLESAGKVIEEDKKQIDCLRNIEKKTAKLLEVPTIV